MKLRILLGPLLAIGLALVPATAWAKGARDVSVKGPGLAEPIALDGAAAQPMIEASGFYTSVFHQSGSEVLAARPRGTLGPRYVATYGWLVAENRTKPLRQVLYPFAEGGALTYTQPRQRVSDRTEPFKGGWYRAGQPLTDLLVSLGVPAPSKRAAQRS